MQGQKFAEQAFEEVRLLDIVVAVGVPAFAELQGRTAGNPVAKCVDRKGSLVGELGEGREGAEKLDVLHVEGALMSVGESAS